MVIAVFGGSGPTGFAFIRQAIDSGIGIRALVRQKNALPELPGLTIIEGDALDGGKVMLTLSGANKVFLCLGNTKNNPKNVVSAGTALVLQGMAKYKIDRVLAITTMGIRGNAEKAGLMFKIMAATFLKGSLQDRVLQEELLEKSPHKWTILRPARLVDNEVKEAKTFLGDTHKPGEVSRIQVAAKALELLEQDLHIKEILNYSS
jgi:putative NADH-flavin reductase